MQTFWRRHLAWILLTLIAMSGLLAWTAFRGSAWIGPAQVVREDSSVSAPPQRIVSLAPSTTEILFALQAGDHVVGVTRYCDYPPDVTSLPNVGGYVDPNYEAIVALKPDLVILLTVQRTAKTELERIGMRTLTIPQQTLTDIHEAIRRVGDACSVKDRADTLLGNLTSRSQAVRRAVEGKARPRVLICIGRDTASGKLAGIYVAGRNGFYEEIIAAAGGINAYQDETVAFPQLSAEGVLQLDPDVIIDLANRMDSAGMDADERSHQWDQLRPVKAVREGRVHVIVGNHALRPGPRYIEFLEQLARLLHPDAFPGDRGHG